jgi:hypothetical protein
MFEANKTENGTSSTNTNDTQKTLLSHKATHTLADLAPKDSKKEGVEVTGTRSTLANATPKIDSPRISASLTPRTRGIRPEPIDTSTSATRSRKISTLSQQRLQKPTTSESSLTVDEYLNQIKSSNKHSTSTTSRYSSSRLAKAENHEEPVKRKVKVSMTAPSKLAPSKPVQRKRGQVKIWKGEEKGGIETFV